MSALKAIAERAAEKGLPFLLIGGHAVVAHGYPRTTFDLDIVVRRSDSKNWQELVTSLGYVLYHEGPAFLQYNHSDLKIDPLDIMMSSDETFVKLQAGSIVAPSGHGEIRIVSLLSLIALKCHSAKYGDAQRIAKDAGDVIGLVEANKLDLKDDEIQSIFFKHGTKEFYEQIQKACDKSNP